MIDFFKISFNDRHGIEHIFNDKNLSCFRQNFGDNKLTENETKKYPKKHYFHNVCLKVTEHTAEMYGSLHKLYNNIRNEGNHNHDDFSLFDLEESLIHLEEHLGVYSCLPEHKLTNLEIGFNLVINESATSIIQDSVLFYDLKKDTVDSRHKKNETLKKFSFTDYEIKIYDKSLQFNLPYNVLRVEVKYTSSKMLKNLGADNIYQLMNYEVLYNLYNDMLDKINNLTILDSWNCENCINLNNEDRLTLQEYTNYHFWKRLRDKKLYMKLSREKDKFEKLTNKLKLTSRKIEIVELIKTKFLKYFYDYFVSDIIVDSKTLC